jgi:hypothetical protein
MMMDGLIGRKVICDCCEYEPGSDHRKPHPAIFLGWGINEGKTVGILIDENGGIGLVPYNNFKFDPPIEWKE